MKWINLAALALIASASAALGQQATCAPRDNVIAMLDERYEEHAIARALASSNSRGITLITEIWVNRDSQTWTITITRPDGVTCIVAAGYAFETLPERISGVPM